MRTATTLLLLIPLAGLAACGGSSDVDMGAGTDLGGSEGGMDAGGTDAGPPDTGMPDYGIDMPPVTGVSTCAELMTSGEACTRCIGTSCCPEYTACMGSTVCETFLTCANACTDDTCAMGCMTAAGTDPTTMAFLSCAAAGACASSCM